MKNLLFTVLFLLTSLPALAQLPSADSKQLIDQQEMRQVLDDFLAEESGQLPNVELAFTSLMLPKPYKVPQGAIEHQVVPARPGVIGSRRVTLLTRVDQQVVSNKSIRIGLQALASVVVVSENLRRGVTLDEDNTVLQQLDISKLKQPIFDLQEVYGKRLKQSLRLGQPLALKQVEFPPTVKRGERVEIHVKRGGLVLSTAGEAQQNGLVGETIRVLNSGSRREVLCRVLSPGQVRVEF